MPAAKPEAIARRSIGRLHDTVDDVVDEVRSRAKAKLHRGAHAMHDTWDLTANRARDAADDARVYLRDHTLLTLGIGLAVGVLMSMALRRGDSNPKT
jgi:ElaB/YqjD/DUF883 family membrane-anchored ribosome-binding protein